MNWCYFNGQITALDKIKISPYDVGLLRGYGAFDMMRGFRNKPFLLKEHFDRLQSSAKALEITLPFDFSEFKKIVAKLLEKNNYKLSAIRTVITGGISPDAFSKGVCPTCYILIEKFIGLPKKIYERGVKIITLNHKRQNPELKINNYIFAIRSQTKKEKANAFEIIYTSGGKVLEGSGSNIFLVRKNELIVTPKLDILRGCMRNFIIKNFRNKLKFSERNIKIGELRTAKEIFITGSGKGIVPVVNINGKKVSDGKIGPITKELVKKYDEFVKSY